MKFLIPGILMVLFVFELKGQTDTSVIFNCDDIFIDTENIGSDLFSFSDAKTFEGIKFSQYYSLTIRTDNGSVTFPLTEDSLSVEYSGTVKDAAKVFFEHVVSEYNTRLGELKQELAALRKEK